MTNDPRSFWNAEPVSAQFSDPAVVARRSTRFARTVRRRNLIEGAAGVLVIGLFGAGALAAASIGEWAFAVAGALVVAGTVFILWHLIRHGSNLARRPEEDCRSHLLGQLARQRDLLRRVPFWYLAPLLPGVCTVYGIAAFKVAEAQGWETALGGVWQPFLATMAFFVFVGGLNLWAARRLSREIGAIEAGT